MTQGFFSGGGKHRGPDEQRTLSHHPSESHKHHKKKCIWKGGGERAAGGAENLNPSSGLTWSSNPFLVPVGESMARDRRTQRNRNLVTRRRTLNTSHTYLLMDFCEGNSLEETRGPNVSSRTSVRERRQRGRTHAGEVLFEMFGGVSAFKYNSGNNMWIKINLAGSFFFFFAIDCESFKNMQRFITVVFCSFLELVYLLFHFTLRDI